MVPDAVPDANWCRMVQDGTGRCQTLIGAGWCWIGAGRKKGARQCEREQKNDIFAYNFLNSFVLLSFEKMVILEVSMTGAMIIALRPDVKHKII